ncbi:MAG: glycosyltransferase 87 family protein [Dermatophilaceae bacterium]
MDHGPTRTGTGVGARGLWRSALLVVSFALLFLVGLARESAALPDLGPRGWAPGTLLPVTLRSAPVSVILATAYLLGAVAIVLGWLRARVLTWTWPMTIGLGALALLTRPFGSADHTSYAAYGRLAALGADPYAVDPAAWTAAGGVDPVIAGVEPPYQDVVSIYGPVATLVMHAVAWLGGDNQRQVVWLWQLVVVVCWLAIRAVLLRLSDEPGRVDLLWTANPLVFGIAVLGAHIDILAAALCLVALIAASGDRRWVLTAGFAAGLAIGVKFTAGIIVPAVLIGWWMAQRRELLGRTGLFALGLLPGLGLYAIWWPDILNQLRLARRHISLASPWRLLLDSERLGPVDDERVRALIVAAAGVACVVLALLLWRITARAFPATSAGVTARVLVVGSLAYVLAAPYSLPWYDLLVWAGLALAARSALDLVTVWRGTVMALAYVPGRVLAMSDQVEEVTLYARRGLAPYAVLLAWLALAYLWARLVRRSVSAAPDGAPRR